MSRPVTKRGNFVGWVPATRRPHIDRCRCGSPVLGLKPGIARANADLYARFCGRCLAAAMVEADVWAAWGRWYDLALANLPPRASPYRHVAELPRARTRAIVVTMKTGTDVVSALFVRGTMSVGLRQMFTDSAPARSRPPGGDRMPEARTCWDMEERASRQTHGPVKDGRHG